MVGFSRTPSTSDLLARMLRPIHALVRLTLRGPYRVRSLKKSIILGGLLALLAMFNVTTLTTWHGSIVGHDDSKVASVLVQAEKREAPAPEIDLHTVAHSVIGGLADVASKPFASALSPQSTGSWVTLRDDIVPGLTPAGLLRPPQG